MISVHINVQSIVGQFKSDNSLNRGINIFLDTIHGLSKISPPIKVFFCREFYLKQGKPGENMSVSLKKNKDLNLRFVQTMQKWGMVFWDSNPVQDFNAHYELSNSNYSSTIVAESIEMQIQQTKGVLINFIDSQYGTHQKINALKIDNSRTLQIQIDSQYSILYLLQLVKGWGIKCQDDRYFEHNPKHHINASIAIASPLNCTHHEAQLLLNSAIAVDEFTTSKLFNFDPIRKQYIIFRSHLPNKYHGYHESEFNNIPQIIKSHFGHSRF